jgi:hypothetical protein
MTSLSFPCQAHRKRHVIYVSTTFNSNKNMFHTYESVFPSISVQEKQVKDMNPEQ